MTRNQIELAKLNRETEDRKATLRETTRANLAKEAENVRSNKAREFETNRSNVINEGLKTKEVQLRGHELTETIRAHKVNEQLTSDRDRETARSNLAREMETHRSNIAQEELSSERNQIAWDSNSIARDTNRINEEHYTRMDQESNRSHLVNEGYTGRNIDLSERQLLLGYNNAEVSRANSETAAAAQRYAADTNAAVGYANVAEATRAHQASEWLQWNQLVEKSYADSAKAESDRIQAQTRQAELQQRQSEWRDAGISESQSRTALNKAKAITERSQAYRNEVETTMGAARNLINTGVDFWRGILPFFG